MVDILVTAIPSSLLVDRVTMSSAVMIACSVPVAGRRMNSVMERFVRLKTGSSMVVMMYAAAAGMTMREMR
ncbi:hypothetical protein HMPREF0240_01780 [Clostridium sp. D5]|nr:hypothetical protein HMPREF0240_01780 [Clostridium sp. D5]